MTAIHEYCIRFFVKANQATVHRLIQNTLISFQRLMRFLLIIPSLGLVRLVLGVCCKMETFVHEEVWLRFAHWGCCIA